MTVFALAMIAAVMPLRYGTPAESEILAEDRTFLSDAYVERMPGTGVPYAYSNAPTALLFSDRLFDTFGYSPTPDWNGLGRYFVNPGPFTNSASGGAFVFSGQTFSNDVGIAAAFGYGTEYAAVTGMFEVARYVPVSTSVDTSLSLDGMRRAFWDVGNTRFYLPLRLVGTGLSADFLPYDNVLTGRWVAVSCTETNGTVVSVTTNTYDQTFATRSLAYTSKELMWKFSAVDWEYLNQGSRSASYRTLPGSRVEMYNAETNSAAVYFAMGYSVSMSDGMVAEWDASGGGPLVTYTAAYGYSIGFFKMEKSGETWRIPDEATSASTAAALASHFGMDLALSSFVPSLTQYDKAVYVYAVPVGVVIQDRQFRTNGEGWNWEWKPEDE